MALEKRQQLGVGPARQHLGEIGPTGREVVDGEPRAGLDQAHGAQMVGLLVADGVGSHVAHDELRLAAQRLLERGGGSIGHEVHLKDRHAFDRLHRQQVDAHHRRPGGFLAHDLAPPAGRDAQVHHAGYPLEQRIFLVELDELVGGAAPVTLGLGLLDVGIVELTLEPAHRGRGAPARRLHPLARVLRASDHQTAPIRGCDVA